MLIVDYVNGKTKAVALLGNPIEHSVSPQLHNTLFRNLNLPYVYVPFRVEEKELGNAVAGLKAMGFAGFNITIPHKQNIIKYLDEVSREAIIMGAVNTVKNINNRLYGYNTDADGFMRSFTEETGTDFRNKKILLLGAGGAARAIAVKLAAEHAGEIVITNRNGEKAAELAELVNENVIKCAKGRGNEVLKDKSFLAEIDIIINSTPSGMYPNTDESPVDKDFALHEGQIVYDVVYNPAQTRFLSLAAQKGCKTVNGLGMLFYQGIKAFEIWTGIRVPGDLLKDLWLSYSNLIRK